MVFALTSYIISNQIISLIISKGCPIKEPAIEGKDRESLLCKAESQFEKDSDEVPFDCIIKFKNNTLKLKMAENRGEKGKRFTDLNEIFEHNTKDSLWLLIHGKVYDVTNYKHPGGKQIFMQNAGMDASTQFDDINH